MAVKKNFVVKNGLEVGDSASITGVLVASGISYPTSDGTSGQVLTTNGAGSLTFQDAGTGAGGGGGLDSAAALGLFTGGTGVTYTSATGTIAIGQSVATSASPTFAGATVNGNIIVTGTVDGRDVAADGTKLDGIEAGATADQTAAEILTAIKTVDGAASGLDADLLDGQQGSYYLNYSNFANTPNVLDSADVLAMFSGGTGVTYTAATGTIAIGQDVSTSASPSFAGLTVDTTTLTVDATNDTVGIGMTASTTASEKLNVNGRIATLSYFSAGAPSATNLYQFMSNDTDTYIGSPAADTIAITTGGSERMRIDSSGNVGIGTTSPSSKLHVNGGSTFGGAITEGTYTPAPGFLGTTPTLNAGLGTIQKWILQGTTTVSDGLSSGQAITLLIDDGSAYTITWPTMTWVNNGGSAPTLATTGNTVVAIWKLGAVLYGALVGDGS